MSPLKLPEFYEEWVKWRDNTSIVGTIHRSRNQSDPLSQEANPRSRFYASSHSSVSSSSDGTISSDNSSEPYHFSEQIFEISEQEQSTENSDEMRSGFMRWTIKQDPEFGDFPFEEELVQIDNVGTPMECFLEYFGDDFCEKVCQLSNEYLRKRQPNSTFILTKLLLRQYAGVIITKTVIRLGSLRRYWKDESRIGYIADNMLRKVFESISRMLHFEEEKYLGSRTCKFQLVIDQFNGKASLEEFLSIDEQIIGYKETKLSMRQYNPKNLKNGASKLLYCQDD